MFLLVWIGISCLLTLYLTRFFYLKRKIRSSVFTFESATSNGVETRCISRSTLVVLGSGGHTTEILRLLDQMPEEQYSPRYYFVAVTDQMSLRKLKERKVHHSCIYVIPRSREVGQSYCWSVLTTIKACLYAIPQAIWINPDLLLVNGPGTCLPLCIAAVLANVLTLNRITITFIESFCRTETLSLTGKLLYFSNICDIFVVQWFNLKLKYPKATFLGRIV